MLNIILYKSIRINTINLVRLLHDRKLPSVKYIPPKIDIEKNKSIEKIILDEIKEENMLKNYGTSLKILPNVK